jgi:ADP-ribose pyrophosphatase YjhB (NUDIX family)
MRTIDIYGDNRFPAYTKKREACRGIVLRGAEILLTYEVNTDQWFTPGGGTETGESLEECCIRELAEETGLVVKPFLQFATVNEYYEDWRYVSHYYLCTCVGETERHLTKAELKNGLEPRWLPLQTSIEIFSKHQDYAEENEMKRGSYLREYQALLALSETKT